MNVSPKLQSATEVALADAAKRSGQPVTALKVTLVEAVTWSDGSLGCPQPDRMYTQALVSGYRIRIAAGNETLEYHGSDRGQPFYCPAERIKAPTADPRV